MKLTYLSFLFCFIIYSTLGVAQNQPDSLVYYSDVALNKKSPAELNKAYSYFKSNYEAASARQDKPHAINNLYYLASIDYKRGAYIQSEQTAVKAIALLDENQDIPNQIWLKKSFYNLLGILYYEQRNKEKSLQLYSKVLTFTDNAKDSAIVYNNTSNIYKRYKDYEASKNALLKAYKITPRLKDTLTMALVLDNLGFMQTLLNASKEGKKLMTRALHLREALKDTTALYNSYAHFAEFYQSSGEMEKAKENALKALQLSEIIDAPMYKNEALARLTAMSKDPYARRYKIRNDSIQNSEKEEANAFALMKYDYSEFEKKALESQLQEERQKSRAIMGFGIALGIALVSIFVYVLMKTKHKKEKLIQVFDTESRISKQIHDEVANDVFHVMTKLENENESREGLINELHSLYYKTRDISKEHSVINSSYPFQNYLEELIESFNDSNTSVISKGMSHMDWDILPEIKRITIYKVLQELLINMKKYSEASLVVIMFKKENKKININYSDNGMGTTLVKRTGLQNTENRILAINGTITFESEPNKGFKVKMSV